MQQFEKLLSEYGITGGGEDLVLILKDLTSMAEALYRRSTEGFCILLG